MENRNQEWTKEEEEMLRFGAHRHGEYNLACILYDTDFIPYLGHRSKAELEEKWKTMPPETSSSSELGMEDESGSLEVETPTESLDDAGTSPTVVAGTSPAISAGSPTAAPQSDEPSEISSLDPPIPDANVSPGFNEYLLEAISSTKDVNGSETDAIVSFMEQICNIPQNFRQLVSSELNRLVQQGKIEKVENRFKLCNETQMVAETPILSPKHGEGKLSNSPSSSMAEAAEYAAQKAEAAETPILSPKHGKGKLSNSPSSSMAEAQEYAAQKVVEAEHASFLAAEAIEKADRISKMAEENEAFLKLAEDIYERCRRGEVVILE